MSPLSDTDPEVIRWTLGRIRSTTSTGTVARTFAWSVSSTSPPSQTYEVRCSRVTKSLSGVRRHVRRHLRRLVRVGVFLHGPRSRVNGTTFKLINLTGNAVRLLDVSGTFHVLTDRKAV